MTTEDTQDIAERCYRNECEHWVTGASDFCSPQCGEVTPHEFVQMFGVMVNACVHCGKWPLHHVHTGDRRGCTCDKCRQHCGRD